MSYESYVNEISEFVWSKVIEYNKQHPTLSQTHLEPSIEVERWKTQYNSVKSDYDVLTELYNVKCSDLIETIQTTNARFSTEQLKNKLLNDELVAQQKYNNRLVGQLDSIKEDYSTASESLKADYKEQITYLKNKIEEITIEKTQLLSLFDSQVAQQVSQRVEGYKKQNDELRLKNDYYYNLYVDKSKGKFYETELYPRLLEYNTKYMGGQWVIEHVGSSASEKCDFMFKHKDSDAIILLDTKNNIQSQSVNNVDVDKFIRDVSLVENNAIGGILLANSRVCNKREFEINDHQGRTLVFISNFNQNNVGFIFSLLELIYHKYKDDQQEIDMVRVKQSVVDDIKFLKERCNSVTTEKRKLDGYLLQLENRFIELYGQRVEEWENHSANVSTFKTQLHETQSMVLDFDTLEEGRRIIGKRSNYYLCYDDPKNGIKKIQYFRDNSKRNTKITKLGL